MAIIVDDIQNEFGRWVSTFSVNKQEYITKSHLRWREMRYRCKVGGSYQRNKPTYIGCSLSENFKDFQLFAHWHVKQIGYNTKGYDLDKDILYFGNKIYSESTCVLIPHQLNKFLVSHGNKRGIWLQGVCYNKVRNLFQANIRINGISKHLGFYKTQEEAHNAYIFAKEAEAYRWYERLKSDEFKVDDRVIERMRTWKFKI